MSIRRYFRYLTIPLIFNFFNAYGQDVSSIIKLADTHFKNESYFKAASFYLKALDAQPNNITAQYRLAESYRLITNYHSAEYYYDLVLRRTEDSYPLARFYHALMQKFNGKYEEALNDFQTFIDNVGAGRYSRLTEKSASVYTEQARIEKEGCLLALKELSKPIQKHDFRMLGEPVNSVYNDYAPFIYHHDSTIVITSARSESRGGNFDSKFGESLTDLFRYQIDGSNWRALGDADRFERMLNTKFHDGSGVFNHDFTSFYYTYCAPDIGGCKIYVTKNIDGKWVEPIALNNNINPPRSDSMHPSLTTRGDTLFFTSNRPDGHGDFDIWMSVSSRENSWGPPKNLGDNINTPFKEISPFYDSKGNSLFLASDGHKGHGGLDIFMAEKIFDPNIELYNMGLPYNSSRDDAFFILGNHLGFLASNREDGMGKFDIYTFQIESDEEIIAEIVNFKEVASRNSLFTSDYDFETDNIDLVEEIVSHTIASRLHGIQLTLTDDELRFFNDLSEADRARIERIINTRMKTINSSSILAVRHEDEFFYQQLSSDFKYHVDKMVKLYIEDYDLAPSVTLNQDDKEFYESLNTNSMEKVDRFIALKLDEYEELDLNDQYYTSLDQATQETINDISVDYLRNKTNLSNVNLSGQEAEFLNGLSPAERAQTELTISNQVASISSLPDFSLGSGEKIFYRNLSSNEKTSVDNMAQAYIQASVNDLENHLDAQDLAFYNNLTPVQKESFDKVLARRIQNFIKADKYMLDALDERDLQRLTELQLSGDVDLNQILNDDQLPEASQLKALASEDDGSFSRLLSSASNLVMLNTTSKLKDVALSAERSRSVDNLITVAKPEIPSQMTSEQQNFMLALSGEERILFDKLLSKKLMEYVDGNHSMLAIDYSQNPQQLNFLERQLTGDMDIDQLLAEHGGLDNATVEAMDDSQKALMAQALISSAKFVIANNTQQLRNLAAQSAISPQFIAQINSKSRSELGGLPIAQNTNFNQSIDRSYANLPAAQFVVSTKPQFPTSVPEDQSQIYNSLSARDKEFVDQALSIKLQEYIERNDPVLGIANTTDPLQLQALENRLAEDLLISNLSSNNQIQVSNTVGSMSTSEKLALTGFLTNAAKLIIQNNADQIGSLAGSTSFAGSNTLVDGSIPELIEGQSIDPSYNNLPVAPYVQSAKDLFSSGLSNEQLEVYNALSPRDQQFVDQVLSVKLQEYIDNSDAVLSIGQTNDPGEILALENRLSNDMQIRNLQANSRIQVTSTVNSKPPAEQQELSQLLTDAAKLVLTNSSEQLSTLSGRPGIARPDVSDDAYLNLPSANIVNSSKSQFLRELTAQQRQFYNNLSSQDRQIVDQVLSVKLQEYIDSNDDVLFLANSSSAQNQNLLLERLNADMQISALQANANISLSNSLLNRSPADKQLFSGVLTNAAKNILTNNADKFEELAQPSFTASRVTSNPNSQFSNLPGNSEDAGGSSVVDGQYESLPIAGIVESNKSLFRSNLPLPQQRLYDNLSTLDKRLVDQVLTVKIQEYINANDDVLFLANSRSAQNQRLLLQRLNNDMQIPSLQANPNIQITNSVLNLSASNRQMFSGMLANAASVILSNNATEFEQMAQPPVTQAFIAENSGNLSPTGNNPSGNGFNSTTPGIAASGSAVSSMPVSNGDREIAQLIESSRSTYSNGLGLESRTVFNNLTLEEKHFMDEALSEMISSYVSKGSRVINLVRSNDPQDRELVQAKLASDFSVNNLSALGFMPTPPSLANRPPSFRSGYSDLMAQLASRVMAANNDRLKQLALVNQSNLIASTNGPEAGRSSGINATSSGSNSAPIPNDPIQAPRQYDATNTVGEIIFDAIISDDPVLSPTNQEFYSNLDPQQQEVFRQVLERKVVEVYRKEPNAFRALQSNSDLSIQNGLSVIRQYADLSNEPNASVLLRGMSQAEIEQYSRLLASSMSNVISQKGEHIAASLRYNGLPSGYSTTPLLAGGQGIAVPNNELYEDQEIVTARVNPSNRKITTITEEDYNYYYDLDPEKRKMIDKVVALRIVNQFAVETNHDLRKDKDYYDALPVTEKRSVKRLSRFLDGDNINDIRTNIVQEDLNYYDNLSNRKKDDINRLIVGDIFNFTGDHNIYGVGGEDQSVLSTLNPREKELFHLLYNIRSQTHNIFGNRLDLDKTIVESHNIIAEVRAFDSNEFENLSVTGSLFKTEGGRPLSGFPVNLVDKNGNVIVSTISNANGEFSFNNIDSRGGYTIQSSDGDLSSRAKDRYFIKDLQVTGNNDKIYVNKYDEFFLDGAQIPYSIQNTISEVSNYLSSDPDNKVFIKITDENYEQAEVLRKELIESLNRHGVDNTDIKYKRELPFEANNPFEGLFRNKVEFFIESENRIPGNNYYSFLVRRDTNIRDLAQQLKVPEEVIIEENSLTSSAIMRNTIIRVWSPPSEPDMSLLVNVSDFQYETYRVQRGESVITIAEKLRLPEELIMEVNNLTSPELINGQVIQIYVRMN